MTSDSVHAFRPSGDLVSPVSVRRILLVHADVEMLQTLRDTLSLDGHAITLAKSFQAALDLLSLFRPDLLVADIRLHAYNGLHLAVRARHVYPGLPVIVTHHLLDRVLQRDAQQIGVPFVARPLTNPAFIRHARAALRAFHSVPA